VQHLAATMLLQRDPLTDELKREAGP
jgi:hypothetical protein